MKDLQTLGVIDAVVEHLVSAHGAKGTVVELNSDDGEMAVILRGAGVNYHGLDEREDVVAQSKKLKSMSKRFTSGLYDGEECQRIIAGADVLLCCRGPVPWPVIPSNTAIVVVTHGFSSWDECCLALAPVVAAGARTVQHGDYFVTYGKRA